MAEAGNWIAGRIAFIFKKTQLECDDVFKAMMEGVSQGRLNFTNIRK